MKLFYLSLCNISQKLTMPLRDCSPALNSLLFNLKADAFAVINRHLHKVWDTLCLRRKKYLKFKKIKV